MGAARVPESLGRFYELARDFRDAAKRGDTGAQERILAQRRRLIPALGESPRPRTEDERQTREEILRSILEIDREAEAILDRQRKELGAELVALDSGRRGLAGYGSESRIGGKWIDERR